MELLRELLGLQEEMFVLLLSMLEGEERGRSMEGEKREGVRRREGRV